MLLVIIGEASDWRLLEGLASRAPHARRVAVLEQGRDEFYLRALQHGSDGVVAASDGGFVIRQAASLAADGQVVIPARVVHGLVRSSKEFRSLLTPDDWSLLAMLSSGMDAGDIGAATGCSERTVYRRLRRLYELMQVSSRQEALRLARRLRGAKAFRNT